METFVTLAGLGEAPRCAALLGVLLTAFLFRVLSQLIQAWRPVAWLPPFEAWHSGALPYPVLVAAQALIIAVVLWCIAALMTGDLQPAAGLGRVLQALGWLYFAVMAARFVLGLSLIRHIRWFDAPLPSIFHLVLAAMVLTLASFHLSEEGPGSGHQDRAELRLSPPSRSP
jgi:hypothetical protein